jgi:hypothetical protein
LVGVKLDKDIKKFPYKFIGNIISKKLILREVGGGGDSIKIHSEPA